MLCWLLFSPAMAIASNLVSVDHPRYHVKIDTKTANIVEYVVRAAPDKKSANDFAVIDRSKQRLRFGLTLDGKTVGDFEQARWSPYSRERQYVVKDETVNVFLAMSLPNEQVRVVRAYRFDPKDSVIDILHSITDQRKSGAPVSATISATFSPQLTGSAEPTVHVITDAFKSRYQVLALAEVEVSRWGIEPASKPAIYPLIGLEKNQFAGIKPGTFFSAGMRSIGLNKTTGALEVSVGPVSIEAGQKQHSLTIEIVAASSPQEAFNQVNFFFGRLKAPTGSVKKVAQKKASVASKPVASQPAPFVTGDDLIPWYWSFQEAFLRSYAGKRAEDAIIIQKIMEEMRRETTVRSCTQTGDQWFTDLGVYYVTLGCEIVVKSSKTEGRPKTGQDNNTELYLVRKDDKWVMAPEGDALGCAIARQVNNEKTWAAYNKQYPQGQCAGQASKETVKPVQTVAEVDLFSAYAFNPDGSRLYTFGNGELLIYTVADGKLVKRIPLKASVSRGQNGLRVSGDGRHVLMGTTRELYLVDVETAKVSVLAYRNPEGRRIDEFQVAFDDDAGQVVVLYSLTLGATYLDRFSIKTGKRVKQFDDDRYIHGFGLSRDGRKVVVLGKERGDNKPTQLAFHSTRDGKKLFEYPVKNLTAFSEPVFTGNDKYVLYDLEDGMVVRDTLTGQPAFKAHEKWLSKLDADETRINGQGSLLLDASRISDNVYLLDIETGKRLLVLNHTPSTHNLVNWPTAAFSPDNQHFVVYFEGKGTLYKLNPAGIARVLK
ncbi:MAG: hypothetical protein CML17_05775 [Pusillimonas sp.]|nr:hypothetical protein [Pusillimonas sp.]